MQQKRNIRLLITLVVLVTATASVYVYQQSGQKTADKNLLRVDDLNQIDNVVLTGHAGNVELTFDGARWKANDHPADASMIDVLFATLQQAEPKRPVSPSIRDSISASLQAQGVKVSLYAAAELKKEFMTGGNPAKTQAYVQLAGDDDVYVLVIPGYRVYSAGIFEMNENGWRDRYVFNFNWRNFQRLQAIFPGSPESNFEIGMGRTYFEVKGLATVDTTRLNDFLDAVSLVAVDQYFSPGEDVVADSIIQTSPVMKILVNDVSGKNYALALFAGSEEALMYARVNDTQTAVIQKRKVANLLKDRAWFATKQ